VRVEALEVAALVALALCYAAGVVMAWASATRLVALYRSTRASSSARC
jgi:hypothetical protein